MEYNGWTNQATWLINLHYINDASLDQRAREMAREAAQEDEPTWYLERAIRSDAKRRLRFFDSAHPLVQDLLDYAIGQVDWREIAEAWLDAYTQ